MGKEVVPGNRKSRMLKGGMISVINDLRVKSVSLASLRSGTLIRGRRVHCISGVSTRKYYDASSKRYNIYPIHMDVLVSLTHLAMCLYNIKKHTKFGKVKVLKVIRSLSGRTVYRITFEAFSSLGDASLFITNITQHFQKVEITSVKIKCSQSDHNGKNSQEVPPPNIPQQRVIKTLSAKSLKDMAPYLSQCALALYNLFTLRVKKDAVHAIPSLKVVKAMKHDAKEGTTYFVTFKASLRDDRKIVETFETQICVPTLFPTMTIDFKEIKIIKQN